MMSSCLKNGSPDRIQGYLDKHILFTQALESRGICHSDLFREQKVMAGEVSEKYNVSGMENIRKSIYSAMACPLESTNEFHSRAFRLHCNPVLPSFYTTEIDFRLLTLSAISH